MYFDFFRKSITLRKFLFLLSPIILIVVIVIVGLFKPSDIPSLKEKPYECGKFGDQQMRIDRKYLFFAKVEYQDVNYWGGYREAHNAKGCNDQIQSATFDVQWPEMLPSRNGFELSSNKLSDFTFSLHQRSVWLDEWGNKDFFDFRPSLRLYLSEDGALTEISDEEVNANKVFNPDLALYQIDVNGSGNFSKKVFWKEEKGKRVSLVIECLYFKIGATECKLVSHVPGYGFNTSYLRIYFHAELLPHWQEIYQHAEQLINSFNTGGKYNQDMKKNGEHVIFELYQ